MKFRDEIRTRLVDRTIGGVTHQVPERFTEQVPVMPRDWDAIATRAAASIVLALTAVAVTWSTVSIGALLGGGVGYAAAGIFDLSWLTVLLLEWLSRFNQAKRRFPRAAGWLLVLLAAGAIAWHGALAGSVALAVVGAAVSVISKLLWLAVFKHIDRPISEADAAWLAAEESRLSAQEAIATVRMRAAAAEERAALRLLQAERIRTGLQEVTGSHPAAVEQAANTAEQLPAVEAEREPSVPLISASKGASVAEQAVPSIASIARQKVSEGLPQDQAVSAVLAQLPGANKDTVRIAVGREMRKQARQSGTGLYL